MSRNDADSHTDPGGPMAEILLLHHAQGCTSGVRSLADRLAAGGHTAHAPDLYEGRTFDTVEEGVAHARSLGDAFDERAAAVAEALPEELVYLGWSLGVMAAQRLAQNRPGARGAVLLESFAPPEFFGTWPDGLRGQVHGMVDDEWFAEDLAAAREFGEGRDELEVFTYAGDRHLFADDSLAAYDAAAAREVEDRLLAFLARVG
ncbi:dienelactone hydrolase family protein [Nocardioides panacisoli]|uniref:dienelactone hydrolase family protein n=1 Tax=Nocardioides panacisoli TaxID=627624 RepID=UPI001C634D33|nr:dienelactone hydrolase family protein [Nocardioides panacisoli]QYJ03397.1 dienelactone hydrolase family protein [Nocardioides panacisoli]